MQASAQLRECRQILPVERSAPPPPRQSPSTALSGKRRGQHSIRIIDQWRVRFIRDGGDPAFNVRDRQLSLASGSLLTLTRWPILSLSRPIRVEVSSWRSTSSKPLEISHSLLSLTVVLASRVDPHQPRSSACQRCGDRGHGHLALPATSGTTAEFWLPACRRIYRPEMPAVNGAPACGCNVLTPPLVPRAVSERPGSALVPLRSSAPCTG